MNSIAYNQIFILLLQAVIIAGLILTLFRLRTIFGLGLLFTALGVFQFIQVFLSSAIYFEVANGIFVTPGNIVFTGSLFAILLIYIREDALEARKVIYAILAANLVMSFMQIVISWGLNNDGVKNIYNLPVEFFIQQSRVVIVGTLVLFLDVFVIIFLYETISKYVSQLFLRIFFTMLLVLTLDTLLFSFGVFVGTSMFLGSLYVGLISKYFAALIFSIIFSFYLHHFDKLIALKEFNADSFKDIFFKLTYRQKFEQVSSENVQLDKQLKKSELLFRSIFERAKNVIYVLSNDGKLNSINPAFEEYTGWAVSDWIGKPFGQLVHPDDIHLANASFKNILEGKEVKPYELRILSKSGEYIVGEFTPSQLISEGKKIGVLGIAMDITDRKKAEQSLKESEIHFRQLFENNPQPMWIYDLETLQFKDVNETALKKYGYAKEEFLTMTLKDIRPLEEVSLLLKNIKDTEGEFQESGIWRHQLKDGTIIFVEIFSHNLNFEQKPSRLVLVNDITERKQAEEEIFTINKELKTINKIITASVSSTNLNEILDIVLTQALQIVGLEGGSICLVEPDDTLKLISHVETSEATLKDFEENNIKVGD